MTETTDASASDAHIGDIYRGLANLYDRLKDDDEARNTLQGLADVAKEITST